MARDQLRSDILQHHRQHHPVHPPVRHTGYMGLGPLVAIYQFLDKWHKAVPNIVEALAGVYSSLPLVTQHPGIE